MTFELRDILWLLLPLAAASGWYAARRDDARRPGGGDGGLSSEYFRGINFLLNEQPDRAIEVFTRMLEVNSETVETHLALGSLFRRRGEVERAIRIHQNLIARPSLDRAQRAQALCELALDYQKAGLLDRAENLFLELAEIPAHAEQALRSLMHIYEQEKDWDKALAVGRRLVQVAGGPVQVVLAQYACELAERALSERDAVRARRHISEALALDSGCTRAILISAHLAKEEVRDRDAINAWKKVAEQEPWLVDEVIEELVAAYRRLGDAKGLQAYLGALTQRRVGLRTLAVVVESIRARDGDGAAEEFLAARLNNLPSVAGLKNLVDLRIARAPEAPREDLALLKAVLDDLTAEQHGYQCRQCGFRAHALHWQCPACHGWVTMQSRSAPDAAIDKGRGKPSVRPGTVERRRP